MQKCTLTAASSLCFWGLVKLTNMQTIGFGEGVCNYINIFRRSRYIQYYKASTRSYSAFFLVESVFIKGRIVWATKKQWIILVGKVDIFKLWSPRIMAYHGISWSTGHRSGAPEQPLHVASGTPEQPKHVASSTDCFDADWLRIASCWGPFRDISLQWFQSFPAFSTHCITVFFMHLYDSLLYAILLVLEEFRHVYISPVSRNKKFNGFIQFDTAFSWLLVLAGQEKNSQLEERLQVLERERDNSQRPLPFKRISWS